MSARPSSLRLVQPERRAALVVRVSTDLQAMNDEGSLKTQLQRLREHVAYKRDTLGEPWEEAQVYELRGISGKDSLRSKEFQPLLADIASGRVNTIVCTALSRVCRSTLDFLRFLELLDEHRVEFVSLKEHVDTTSPHGRLLVTVLVALAQFEREQTAERTRDAVAARARRGLWNGGRLLGYDLDPDRRGYLLVNEQEAALVSFAFATYLETGSITRTAEEVNRRGYRTKSFTSRRGVEHPGHTFSVTNMQILLKNPAYVGMKAFDRKGDEQLVEAVWAPIVSRETFDAVQRLMALNGRANHSQAKPVRHVHVLNGGLLRCGRCDAAMVGRSGNGRGGKTYFYYVCPEKDCGIRAVAPEVESAVVSRIGLLAANEATVARLTAAANASLASQKPDIEKRLRALRRQLKAVEGEVASAVRGLGKADAATARTLNAQLAEVSRRREESASALLEAEAELADLDAARVTPAAVRDGLREFGRAFSHLRPFEQRELVRMVLKRAILRDEELVLEFYGNALEAFGAAATANKKANPGSGFAQPPSWLPGSAAQSVLVDSSECRLMSLVKLRQRETTERRAVGNVRLRQDWERQLAESGTRAGVARAVGVSRARVTQILRSDLQPKSLAHS